MIGNGLTVGVEEEFLLVREDGRLARSGPEVVGASGQPGGQLQEEITRTQVESATTVCTSGEQLREQLSGLRAELAAEAAARGLRLLPSGTPLLPESESAGITPRLRYERIAALFGAVTGVSTNCGCHVHVGIPDRATGVELSNRLRCWLPVLLALSANSPFVDGFDSGYSSWRYVRWALWPSAGAPPVFESVAQYDDSVGEMLRSGAILDRGMVYWDIRLSDKQPTLEFRVGDVAATADEGALFAVVVAGLVARALADLERGRPAASPRHEVLRAFLWRAARDGLAGLCPSPLTGELLSGDAVLALVGEYVRPVLRDDDIEFVRSVLDRVARDGGGADRQRAAYARGRRLTDVVNALVWPQR
ncbi:carboxylate-amine ligase [Prauserella shujinwangii]|uniref:Putative glutamate--cysteine ligase 2 n=1 Tax=Prauserella shujinwangii TaxID=1453103 RepID=A0A2T0LSG2_9PSEU|nr:glutamate--cysteine ligase [Prauserella shujinwangii]PRX46611.1 carboxylate-amine ligase [Prauserella shujinwangii]